MAPILDRNPVVRRFEGSGVHETQLNLERVQLAEPSLGAAIRWF